MTSIVNTSTMLEVKIKTKDPESGELKEVMSAEVKLIKSDTVMTTGDVLEEELYVCIKLGTQPDYSDATVDSDGSYKLTKADAGITN